MTVIIYRNIHFYIEIGKYIRLCANVRIHIINVRREVAHAACQNDQLNLN